MLYIFSIILVYILDSRKYTKHNFVPSRKFFPSSNLEREEDSCKICITICSFVEIYPFSSSNRDKINEMAPLLRLNRAKNANEFSTKRIFTLCVHCDSRNSRHSMEISTLRIITLDSSVSTTLSLPVRSSLSPRKFLHQTL